MKKYGWMSGLAILMILMAFGCAKKEKVDQGRVIKFDKANWTVTLIRDKKADHQNPDYSELPPITYALPTDPLEMGPEPKAGLRLKLDLKNNQITIYDPTALTFKTIDYTLIDKKEKIARDNPLVFEEGKPKKFPVIDREKKTITVYSRRQQTLATFTVPEENFGLPEYTWDAGDEVRIKTKKEGKADRFINITQSDFFKK